MISQIFLSLIPFFFIPGSNLEEFTKRRRNCQTKLEKWVSGKVTLNDLQKESYLAEIAAKRKLEEIRIRREEELSTLLKEEVKERIRLTLEKHTAEMEILAIEKANKLM